MASMLGPDITSSSPILWVAGRGFQAKGRDTRIRKTDSIHHHYPEGVVYRSSCLNSSTVAVSEIPSRRWWCIESLFPIYIYIHNISISIYLSLSLYIYIY